MNRKHILSLLSSAAALVLVGGAASAKVGVASVVEGEPTGLPPGGTERVLRVGIDMNADEKVTTKDNDRAHLVFMDGSSLTVGPNSVLLIDKFVYDPDQKTGEMALNMQRGTLRFVGGIISKKSDVTITTPSAQMAIRGGILTVGVSATGATTANFLFGSSFSITSQNVTRTITQPGTQVSVAPGEPPSLPTPIRPGSFSTNVASFEQSPANGPGTGPKIQSMGALLTNTGFTKLNSGMTPGAVLAATPTKQQIALILTAPGGSHAGGGSDNRQFAGAGGNPLQGAGPLLGPGTLQGTGPFLGAVPLLGANPLFGGGPVEGTGPLASVGPLQGGPPLSDVGPTTFGGPINISVPPPSGQLPIVLVSIPPQALQPLPAPANIVLPLSPNTPSTPSSSNATVTGGSSPDDDTGSPSNPDPPPSPFPLVPCLTCNTTPPPNNVPSQSNGTQN